MSNSQVEAFTLMCQEVRVSSEKVVEIPRHLIDVVGAGGGSTVRSLAEASGAEVRMDDKGETVLISGSSEAVRRGRMHLFFCGGGVHPAHYASSLAPAIGLNNPCTTKKAETAALFGIIVKKRRNCYE